MRELRMTSFCFTADEIKDTILKKLQTEELLKKIPKKAEIPCWGFQDVRVEFKYEPEYGNKK